MKQAGDPVKLRMSWWHGARPVAGDVLRTKTGRRYWIMNIRWPVLDCVVLGADEITEGATYHAMEWAPRRRAA